MNVIHCITFILPLWCLQSLTHTEVNYVHPQRGKRIVIHFCMSDWLKTPQGQDERSSLLYEWVTEDTKGARWYTSVWVSDWRHQRGKMNVIHFCTVNHSYRSVLRSSCPSGVFSHSLIQKCITFILSLGCLQSLTHTEVYYVHPRGKMNVIHFCMSEWLKTPKGQDERNTLLYEWVTEDTKGAFTHTEVYYVHLAPLVSSVTHSYRSILRSSVSHSLIQKCITFILSLWCLQSLTHTEVYYVHLVPLVSSVTHS
jgi:hypothetical protein